jgi:hypothetical protein
VRVRRYGEGGQRQWCRVNALVLAREERRQNEVLSEVKRRHRARLGSITRKSMTRFVRMAMSDGGEVPPRPRNGKEGDDANWADVNLTGPKNEENQRG